MSKEFQKEYLKQFLNENEVPIWEMSKKEVEAYVDTGQNCALDLLVLWERCVELQKKLTKEQEPPSGWDVAGRVGMRRKKK